jgi:hypothetical protein
MITVQMGNEDVIDAGPADAVFGQLLLRAFTTIYQE